MTMLYRLKWYVLGRERAGPMSTYSAAYRVFILGGLYREGPGPGGAKAGGMAQIR